MSPKEFIFNWLLENRDEISLDKVDYGYHDYSDTYFVYCEPSPDELDANSQKLLTDFIVQFEAAYKNATVGLLDEKSLTKLENPESIFNSRIEEYTTKSSYLFDLNLLENHLHKLVFNEPEIRYKLLHEFDTIFRNQNIINLYQFTLRRLHSTIIQEPSIFFELIELNCDNRTEEAEFINTDNKLIFEAA